MILGLSVPAFLAVHVTLSFIGIVAGLVVLVQMVGGRRAGLWTAVFLGATVLTSATGFPLPPYGLDPPRIIGVVSLVLLAAAIAAYYVFGLAQAWRWIYVVTATLALYFNCFVAVAQAFQKIPALEALAPNQSEPPFAVAQLAVLVLFVALGFLAVRRFRPTDRRAPAGV